MQGAPGEDLTPMKRLFYDIETSPNIGLFWQPGYKLSISYENIIKERAIICICYKWQGKRVQSLTWDKNQCDKKMIAQFAKIMMEADELVAHNGDQFDVKWIRGRALFHGISLPPDLITIDTCKLARQHFNLNSNRLDYIAKYLGVGEKIHTEFQMWKDILLERDSRALAKMVRYCNRDVAVLERVYKKMKPYVKSRLAYTDDRTACPECGGNMVVNQQRTLASGARKTALRCVVCGKYHTIATSTWEKKNGNS